MTPHNRTPKNPNPMHQGRQPHAAKQCHLTQFANETRFPVSTALASLSLVVLLANQCSMASAPAKEQKEQVSNDTALEETAKPSRCQTVQQKLHQSDAVSSQDSRWQVMSVGFTQVPRVTPDCTRPCKYSGVWSFSAPALPAQSQPCNLLDVPRAE